MPIRQTRYLRERFVALGVSKNLASQLAAEVSRFSEESGPEWTVNRLKLLKTGFLKRIAGEPYKLPYVATRKDVLGPVPKGPFGVLWEQAKDGSDLNISRVLNCLMVYSAIKAERVTPKQWEKFHMSMTRPQPDPDGLKGVLNTLRVPKWMRVRKDVGLDTVEQFVVRKQYTASFLSKAVFDFVESDTGMALWEEFPQYEQSFGSLRTGVDSRIRWDDMFNYHPELNSRTTSDPIGRLGFTQEPGYKLRVFASPNIVHQLAMSRLKVQLFDLLRQVHWDCTYNQSNGTDWVKAQLACGRRVWSIDLSDATNNFPLEVQVKVLREIGCRSEDVELFHRLSRAVWSCKPFGKTEKHRWTVGQPLGLGPSFAAFALTHGVLVHSIARANRVTDCFRVLGDDIVISEEQVASDYLQAMQRLGIPVSLDKTICSSSYAEFAGKLVTRTGVIAALKWREPSDRSFLDVVQLLGPGSLSLLRQRQKTVASFISVLPQPEGFGWNPDGIPLEWRLKVLELWNEIATDPERSFVQVQRQWNRIASRIELPYFKLHFTTWPEGSWWDNPVGKAPEFSSREPTPVGSVRHLLSISEITGSPLKLTESECTPQVLKELSRRGFTAPSRNTDPRGITPLEGLEARLATLLRVIEQRGLKPTSRSKVGQAPT